MTRSPALAQEYRAYNKGVYDAMRAYQVEPFALSKAIAHGVINALELDEVEKASMRLEVSLW